MFLSPNRQRDTKLPYLLNETLSFEIDVMAYFSHKNINIHSQDVSNDMIMGIYTTSKVSQSISRLKSEKKS